MSNETEPNNPKDNRERVRKLRAEDIKKRKRTMPRPSSGIRSHLIGRRTELAEGGKVDTQPPSIDKED